VRYKTQTDSLSSASTRQKNINKANHNDPKPTTDHQTVCYYYYWAGVVERADKGIDASVI
jgi:hypothetical protein